MNEIRITRNYSFWRHPIRWWKDRKYVRMADAYFQFWVKESGLDARQVEHDLMMYGGVITKDGKRVDPRTLYKEKAE